MTPTRAVLAVLVLVIAGLQWRLWIGEGSLAHVSALSDRADRLSVSNEARVERNKILRAEIVDLKNGLESIEEKARVEFGLIKEGETFFLVVDEDAGAITGTVTGSGERRAGSP